MSAALLTPKQLKPTSFSSLLVFSVFLSLFFFSPSSDIALEFCLLELILQYNNNNNNNIIIIIIIIICGVSPSRQHSRCYITAENKAALKFRHKT